MPAGRNLSLAARSTCAHALARPPACFAGPTNSLKFVGWLLTRSLATRANWPVDVVVSQVSSARPLLAAGTRRLKFSNSRALLFQAQVSLARSPLLGFRHSPPPPCLPLTGWLATRPLDRRRLLSCLPKRAGLCARAALYGPRRQVATAPLATRIVFARRPTMGARTCRNSQTDKEGPPRALAGGNGQTGKPHTHTHFVSLARAPAEDCPSPDGRLANVLGRRETWPPPPIKTRARRRPICSTARVCGCAPPG